MASMFCDRQWCKPSSRPLLALCEEVCMTSWTIDGVCPNTRAFLSFHNNQARSSKRESNSGLQAPSNLHHCRIHQSPRSWSPTGARACKSILVNNTYHTCRDKTHPMIKREHVSVSWLHRAHVSSSCSTWRLRRSVVHSHR